MADVESILLARDSAGVPAGPVSSFRSGNNPLHAVIRLNGVEKGTRVRAAWVAVDAGGEKNYTVASQDLTAEIQGNIVNFTVSLPRPWPPGHYRIDVYINENLTRSLVFEVEESR
jgi:hypothetical protein